MNVEEVYTNRKANGSMYNVQMCTSNAYIIYKIEGKIGNASIDETVVFYFT